MRVRVAGVIDDLVNRSAFHDAAAEQDTYVTAHCRDQPQVIGDEEDADTEL